MCAMTYAHCPRALPPYPPPRRSEAFPAAYPDQ